MTSSELSLKKRFLKRLKITRFGAFADKAVGPFGPGMNVVFGRNEAGKTTVASFIGGVLFGWEEGRGRRNAYLPEEGERAGMLVFEPHAVLCRNRNSDGLQGDTALAEDVDAGLYRTLFSLTSDELRSLRHTTDVTTKLLAAGTGGAASPARALAEVQERLRCCTDPSCNQSVPAIAARCQQLRAQKRAQSEEADRFRKMSQELRGLRDDRDAMAQRIAKLNDGIEGLSACREGLGRLEEESALLREERAALAHGREEAEGERRRLAQSVDEPLASLSAARDRALRERIDGLAEREARLSRNSDLARSNLSTSRLAYEVLAESGADEGRRAEERRARRTQLILSVLFPVALVLGGVPLFVYGRQETSLSYMLLGLAMVMFSLILAGAALVLLRRPSSPDADRRERTEDALWVMRQDEKRLAACVAEEEEFAAAVAEELAESGLGEADGLLRRARAILDEAKDVRAEIAVADQQIKSATARMAECDRRLAAIEGERARLCERAEVAAGTEAADIDEELLRRTRRRDELLEAFEDLNRHHGELSQRLNQAAADTTFDELKIRYEQERTRLADATEEVERLLLAEQMLLGAIDTWEAKSQPEVYRQASRLMALMTGGRWTTVALSAQGVLQVADAEGAVRDPNELSLGTCQQLFLAMRLALLMTARDVGRAIPVLADDVLVNFDAERRRGAARALAELARYRQVILFTCHEEVVRDLREADPQATLVDL